jgi:lipoprotein-releasing system permease protein
MNSPIPLFLSFKYISRGSLLAALPIVTVMLAVAFLVVIFSVANGLDSNLITKTISMTSHIRVSSADTIAFADYMEFRSSLMKFPLVKSASPRFVSEVLVSSSKLMAGSRLVGVVPSTENRKSVKLPDTIGEKGIIMGDGLFKKLSLKIGEEVSIKGNAREDKFKIEGTFSVGIYDYDSAYMFGNIEEVGKLGDLESTATEVVIEVADPEKAPEAARELEKTFGCRAESWQEMNRDLLVTIRVERFAMLLISAAAIFIATLSIAFLSITNTFKRQRDIGILKALGTKNSTLIATFLLEGFILGLVGLMLGIGLSYVACDLIASWRIPLPVEASSYYSALTLPVIVDPSDIAKISWLVLLFSILSSTPCLFLIFRMNPSEIMRSS